MRYMYRNKFIFKRLRMFNTKFFLVILIAFCSCVQDDIVVREDDNQDDIVTSTAIVTLLNSLKSSVSTLPEEALCFTFQYPIVLGYNTTSSIEVTTYQGVVDVISSQSDNFNITGLEFPVVVILEGNTQISIDDEASFLEVFDSCQITPFRQAFDQLYGQCFELDIPVVLIEGENEEITFNTADSLVTFLENQQSTYSPDFKFPIGVSVLPEMSFVEVSTYYQLYEIMDTCSDSGSGCPTVVLGVEQISGNVYIFSPDFEVGDDYELIYSINEVVIAESLLVDGTLTKDLDGGVNEICLKVITPDCPEGEEVCEEVFVP